ncbi:MAG: type II toxin-antitoxin system HicB family antitoxin [Candidatus Zambryskibacteria bacterium]|nr:type II toxin-antitoxin system HicB family antitoxin [Candidatus Zambryskibacteria bacterium]
MKKTYSIRTKYGDFKVNIWLNKSDNAYLVKGVSLPQVVTFGRTLVKAKKMAKEALELYCECVINENKIIIDDSRKVVGKLPKSRIIQLA